VALAEIWPRPVKEISVPWPIRWAQAAAGWTLASIAVSFVAGLATGPFAIQHFNRVSTWGLFANLAVAPVSSFLLMPGLGARRGADAVRPGRGAAARGRLGDRADQPGGAPGRRARRVAGGGAERAGLDPAGRFFGLLFVCLWRGPLRWAGLPLALASCWSPRPPAPDVWVSADGAAVAVRDGKAAVLLRPDVKLFGAELWARRRGLTPLETRPTATRASTATTGAARQAAAPLGGRGVEPAAAAEGRAAGGDVRGADLVILRNDFRPESCRRRWC
jgi:competence protein ComEC